MAHKFNFGQNFLVWVLSLIMISILVPLTAKVAKASCPLPSFVTNQSFPSGTNNQGAAVGDVNNDGKLDIVTTNNIQPNNQISVILGIGDGTFQSPVNTTTENGAARIVLADFNNDAKLDVAITINQSSGIIAVHLGNGNGTFGFSDIFSAGNFPALIHSADFNNDGKRDIVFTGKSVATGIDHFGVMFGTGTGTFGTPTYYPFNNQHSMVDTLPIDINQDNFIDLVATRGDQLSYPYINNGNGIFTPLTATPSIDGSNGRFSVPTSAAVGDFNADGRNEVAVGFQGGFFALARVGILFRNGASNAQQPFVLRDWFRVWGGNSSLVSDIAAADFNGDGRSDLAFLESGSQSISIQLDTTVITNGTGSPPINAEQRIGDNATSYYAGVTARQILTGDFNNDGKIDLAVRNENGSTMQILLNSGAGRFNAAFRPFVVDGGAFEFDESKSDLNDDGLTDLVAIGDVSTVNPFLGSIKGNFRNTALRAIDDNISNPLNVFKISLGDFDSDGKKDMVGAGVNNGISGLRFLHGNGDGTFTDSNNSTNQGVQYYSTAVGDFNSDNKLDVVAITSTNIGLFRSNGQGVFFSPINSPAGTDLRFIVSQDFNGDGKPDVAATDFAENRVVVLLGNGAAGFGTPVNFTVGTNPTKLALADFNTDGKIDIVTANEGSNNVSVLLGNGLGGFGTATNFAIGVKPVWVTSGDTNNDGKLDLLTANHDANSVSILLGNGDGIFNAPSNITYNMTRPTSVTLQDANFDSRPDLITGMASFQGGSRIFSMSVLLNSCDANPTAPRTKFDFDGDGKTDISIFRPAPAEWWYQRSSDGQVPAAQFGASNDKIVPGDFTGDGKTDIAVFRPSNGFWLILRSEDGSFFSFPFGTSGDIPVPSDYDGDGRTDPAVFRPSTSTWFILNSGGGTAIQQFGQSGDAPIVADYDGDGRGDIAIFRPSVGEWWYQRSSNGIVGALQFGTSSDKPVPGDYTGDGRSDIAFFRPTTGFWFILRSEDNSFFSFPFGASGDLPAPGDYDGDGKFDTAVFRPSSSTWFVNQSTAGILIQGFGTTGDQPIPNVFIP